MDEKRMTFAEHLIELRSRLIKSLLALGACFVVALVFRAELLHVVQRPHELAIRWLRAEYPNQTGDLISFSYARPFFAYMKLAFLVGAFFASPVIGYQAWRFIGAGLYPHERKWVLLFAPASFVLFTGGCLFGYFVMIPYGLYYLALLSDPATVKLQFAVSEYIDFVMLLTIILGAIFQLPLVMVFFAKVGLVTAGQYLRFWRYAVLIVVIASAVLTPGTDPVSQLLMAGPMLVLYFLGVGLSALVGARRTSPAASQ